MNTSIRRRNVLVPAIALLIALSWTGRGASGAGKDLALSDSPREISVLGNQTWTPTGLKVNKGDVLSIIEKPGPNGRASEVFVRKGALSPIHASGHVTARGSYTIETFDRDFPMPSYLEDGRFPAYCLIGRIEKDGAPFYVGPRYAASTTASGQLWLGINDPDPTANTGRFVCDVSVGTLGKQQVDSWPKPAPDVGTPAPAADANVVIFFLDGMRPDTLIEMAQMGHMPTFEKLFLSGGTYVRNTFCMLPSLTETNFTSMMTGTFSDKHGVKMQWYYDREDGRFYDNLDNRAYPRIARQVRRNGVKALYDYFPDSFGAAALPMQPRSPEVLRANLIEWLHRTLNVSNYMGNLTNNMDESQTRFALDLASFPNVKVMVIWLPATDMQDEEWPHGQFGHVRTNVAKVDDCMAQIVRRLQIRGRLDKTYFVVFSDHGTVGGNGFVNQKFDVAREILNPHFHLNTVSRYQERPCPGTPRSQFAILSDADGAVEITLPYRKADSGDLWRPNFLGDLQNYLLADGRHLRALDVLTEFVSKGRVAPAALPRKPVDFAATRADARTIFVQRTAQSQAFITRARRPDGELEFKYEPVRNYLLGGSKQSLASGDPLRYLDSPSFAEAVARKGSSVAAWLGEFHTGRDWLKATAGTEYPGCIDGIGRFFFCEDSTKERNLPDVLLFANRGWVFVPKVALSNRSQEIAGTRHGMAFEESTRICMFFSGPGIARGRVIEEPHRTVDILPTVLTMMSKDWKGNGLDGVPIDGVWEGK